MADLEESDYSGSESDSDEESEEEMDERPLKVARKDAVYNTDAMHEKLEEIGWPENVEWIQTLSITLPDNGTKVDVNDDLVREMAFYTQALEGAKEAYLKLQTLGLPFLRPSDYYAEMVKTDTHMLKIKDKLLFEKSKMEETDERRKAREAKKFSKEVQAETLKDRAKRKKEDIESVKKWRKVRQKSGHAEGEDGAPPIEFSNGRSDNPRSESWRSRGRGDRGGRGGRGERGGRGNRSRQFRDSKYGNGGRKGGMKRNDAESSADDSAFRGSFRGKERGRGGGRGRGSRGRGVSRGRGRGRGRG